jgi:hypothetical protein
MPRGRIRANYIDDQGVAAWVWVDRDSFADTNRGWAATSSSSTVALGRAFLPRRVVGVDELGHTRYTRVATLTAPLWTGVATFWQYEGSDRLLHTATVVARQEERGVA